MTPSKAIYFLVELITCYGTVYYSYFLFFYMKIRFGFGKEQNLLLAALYGLLYIFAAWYGGAFAQRFGCRRSLLLGFLGLAASMTLGWLTLHSAAAQVVVLAAWTVSVCFIWPALEAIVSEGDSANLADMCGYYNITWAAGGAVAYFSGGMLLERLGMQSLFWVPLSIVAADLFLLALAVSLAKREKSVVAVAAAAPDAAAPAGSRGFLHLAWLANPLAYVAINTTIPLIPSISVNLGLSTAAAGMVCSLWMFARLAAFVVLWRWTWWHYRFRVLAVSFTIMALCFAGIVLASSLWMLVAAQIGFGLSVGLIYYSSLYYSMNVSDKRGAHGGLHEAMIGAGLFFGPACGAFFIFLLPRAINAGALSVGGLLAAGFSAMLLMRKKQLTPYRRFLFMKAKEFEKLFDDR